MNVIYKSRCLCWLYCKISQLRYSFFRKEVIKRSYYDIFDYRQISKPLPKYYTEICTDNNCFGIGYSIRKYAGYQKSYINGWVEHGYFYSDVVSSLASISFSPNILTFGSHRVKINNILLPNKKCIPIGPYLHYADDYIGKEEFQKLKEQLGRVLLVFPVHAATGVNIKYEEEKLISIVESVAGEFDTVIFSLFWTDINDGYVTKLEKRGFRIVCSGHRYDPYFLCRQKTIIKLADVTMSNGIGTNLVYCTFYKKPHWLIKQDSIICSQSKVGSKHLEYIKKNSNSSSIKSQLFDLFKEYSEILTDEQYKFCSDLFGFEEIKSPKEMLKMLKEL